MGTTACCNYQYAELTLGVVKHVFQLTGGYATQQASIAGGSSSSDCHLEQGGHMGQYTVAGTLEADPNLVEVILQDIAYAHTT